MIGVIYYDARDQKSHGFHVYMEIHDFGARKNMRKKSDRTEFNAYSYRKIWYGGEHERERKTRTCRCTRRRKRRQVFAGRMIITILLLVIVLLCLFLGKDMLDKKKRKDNRLQSATETQTSQEAQQVTTESTQSETQTETAAKKRRYGCTLAG